MLQIHWTLIHSGWINYNLNFTAVGQLFLPCIGQFGEWVEQCPCPTDILRLVDRGKVSIVTSTSCLYITNTPYFLDCRIYLCCLTHIEFYLVLLSFYISICIHNFLGALLLYLFHISEFLSTI